jgi:protein-S-isoprenylcysteine O-methyltransferase Ste14
MAVVGLGLLGFLAGMGFDGAMWLRLPRLRRSLGILAGLALAGAHILAGLGPRDPALPAWALWAGWPIMAAAGFLLVYSLFIELPFQSTYVAPGGGARLLRTGTYALVRHPGVLWYAAFLLGLLLVSRSSLVLMAAPVWLAADVAWVLFQERTVLPQAFPEYDDYQRETPMLLPSWRSLRACMQTLGRPQVWAEKGG